MTKIPIVMPLDTPVIEFRHKKHIQFGIDQYYKFELEIIQKEKNISIENINLCFKISERDLKELGGKTQGLLSSVSSSNFFLMFFKLRKFTR